MKTAFKISSLLMLLLIASCQKDVIVPSSGSVNAPVKSSSRVGVTYSDQTSSGITDPNDRNWKFIEGIDGVINPAIMDPTDSGNSNGKKPKR